MSLPRETTPLTEGKLNFSPEEARSTVTHWANILSKQDVFQNIDSAAKKGSLDFAQANEIFRSDSQLALVNMGEMAGCSVNIIIARNGHDTGEEASAMIDAAGNMFLNTAVVGALVMSILLPLLLAETEPCDTTKLLIEMIGNGDDFNIRVIVIILQHVQFAFLAWATYKIMLVVMKSSKSYSQLCSWAPETESKLWHLKENCSLMEYDIAVNDMLPGAIKGLIPHVLLARGPVCACLVGLLSWYLQRRYSHWLIIGFARMQMYLCNKILSGKILSKAA